MAAAHNNPVKDLQDELTCSICLDHFKDPVSVECGHSFCRTCIVQTWRGIRSNFPCPQCRQISKWKFLRPNRPLENMVDISKRLLLAKETKDYRNLCKKHEEPLKLYCQVDAREICVICRESVDHRSHAVIPLEEKANKFKLDVQERLKSLRKEVTDIVKHKAEEEEKALKLQDEVMQKQKMVASEFESLRHLLDDQEKHIIHRLECMQKSITEKKTAVITRLNTQCSCIQETISDLEKGAGASANQSVQDLKASSTRHTSDVAHPLSRLSNQHGSSPTQDFFKTITAPMSFDLKTANHNLVVTRNRKCVKFTEEPVNRYPCPERFDTKPCVLATTGFRSGRHYWEVNVGGGIYWTIGAARKSVCRNGAFKIEPSIGIWAIALLGMYTDRYYAFTNPDTLLNPREHPERIGIYLNCDESYLSFYNAVNFEHLFTFKSLQIHDKIYPFFCVGALGTELRLDDDLFEMF